MSARKMEHPVESSIPSWCEPIGKSNSCSAAQQARFGSTDGLELYAPAKINLNLLVAPKRRDGYHPLDSLVAKITLYDRLEVRLRDDGKVNFASRGLDCGPDLQNLAFAAAQVLAENRRVPGADVVLEKRIPPGSGLGGGSSDAAVVLGGLNNLWKLGLGREELSRVGAELGSDVPLFLGPAAVRMTGRGETIKPIKVWDFRAVLVLPDIVCPTGAVYDALDTRATETPPQLDISLLRRAPSEWRALLVNQLLPAALSLRVTLVELHETLTAAAELPVCLTGSGSAMFILCDDEPEAMSVLNRLPPTVQPLCRIVRRNSW